jgi:hypothetical protein
MVAFTATCTKGLIFPCTSTEKAELRGTSLNWGSELIEPSAGVFDDEFKSASIEVECLTSLTKATYSGSLRPQVLVNKLVFTSGSGTLISGTHSFALDGSDKLKGLTYKKIQAK